MKREKAHFSILRGLTEGRLPGHTIAYTFCGFEQSFTYVTCTIVIKMLKIQRFVLFCRLLARNTRAVYSNIVW